MAEVVTTQDLCRNVPFLCNDRVNSLAPFWAEPRGPSVLLLLLKLEEAERDVQSGGPTGGGGLGRGLHLEMQEDLPPSFGGTLNPRHLCRLHLLWPTFQNTWEDRYLA